MTGFLALGSFDVRLFTNQASMFDLCYFGIVKNVDVPLCNTITWLPNPFSFI